MAKRKKLQPLTFEEVMRFLEENGNEQTKNIYIKHGAKDPFFGVKVADLKKVLKRNKNDHELALKLYETGNSDAMYLAGLMADATKITKEKLEEWVKKAYWYMLSEYTVADLAAESRFGWELGLKWIESDRELTAAAGWGTLSAYLSFFEDSLVDKDKVSNLLDRVLKNIDSKEGREKFCMNHFVIAVGSFYLPLADKAIEIANQIGEIKVDMGETSCKVPIADEYIKKVIDMGRQGQKRKKMRC